MRIFITPAAFEKYKAYIKYAEGEISGLGKVKKIDKETFLIEDVRLFEQECTGATTTLQQDDVAKFLTKLIKEGEDTSVWKCWWHSHANFSVFWSGTDTSTIDDFDNDLEENNYIISIVGNKNGDFLARIDSYAPFRSTIDDLDIEIDIDWKLDEECRLDVIKNITTPQYNWNKNNWTNDKVTKCEQNFDQERFNQYSNNNFIDDIDVPDEVRDANYIYDNFGNMKAINNEEAKSKLIAIEEKRREALIEKSCNKGIDPYKLTGCEICPTQFINANGVYVLGSNKLMYRKTKNLTKFELNSLKKAQKRAKGKHESLVKKFH